MTPESIGKRDTQKTARREKIAAAALDLFRLQGYDATTVDQIALRAGVAKGTFFNYFATKDAVLRYLGSRQTGRIEMGALSGGAGKLSHVSNLRRLMVALAASLEGDRELVRLVLSRGVGVADLLAGQAGGLSLQPTASLLLRAAQRTREINPSMDADTLAAALDALYLQQLVRWCEADEPYPLADYLTGVLDLLLMGMAGS